MKLIITDSPISITLDPVWIGYATNNLTQWLSKQADEHQDCAVDALLAILLFRQMERHNPGSTDKLLQSLKEAVK